MPHNIFFNAFLLVCLLLVSPCVIAQELVVSAAASLTNAFNEIGREFERAHASTRIIFNYAASDILVQQLEQGAPVAVIATADQVSMDKAVKAGLIIISTRVNFARNKLVLAHSVLHPGSPKSLHDLENVSIKRIAIGKPQTTPIGRYAKSALEVVKLWESLQPKYIYTQNVRQALDYIARGEVDVGFVYATDVATMPDKVSTAMEIPTRSPITYPIAMVGGSSAMASAKEFVAYVTSDAGQKILSKYGFSKP